MTRPTATAPPRRRTPVKPGDVAPASIADEASIIGSFILTRKAEVRLAIADSLKPENFFRPAHAGVFSVLVDAWRGGLDLDLVTARSVLADAGVLARLGGGDEAAGLDYLEACCEQFAIDPTVPHVLDGLKNKAARRRLISLGERLTREATATGADAAEIIDSTQAELDELATTGGGSGAAGPIDLADAVAEAAEHADAIARGEVPAGLPSGFSMIDAATGGMQPGDLWTVGAGTSVGKSAFALAVARNVARSGVGVLLVSAEMTARQIGNRLLAMETEVPAARLRAGELNEAELDLRHEALERIRSWRLAIIDHAMKPADVGVHARMLAHRWGEGPGLIVADYLQILTPPGGETRAEQVGRIAWGLKEVAMQHGAACLALSQLSRAGTRDKDAPPELGHLRESGDLENHSNAVLLLHRPAEGSDGEGGREVWARVAKARDGQTTAWPRPSRTGGHYPGVRLRFWPATVSFEDWQRSIET